MHISTQATLVIWRMTPYGNILAPSSVSAVNVILANVYTSIQGHHANGMDRRFRQCDKDSRSLFKAVLLSLTDGDIDKSILDPVFVSLLDGNTDRFRRNICATVREYTPTWSHAFSPASDERDSLCEDNHLLLEKIENTEHAFQFAMALKRITEGVNVVDDEVTVFNAIAKRLGIQTMKFDVSHYALKDLGCDIRNVFGVKEAMKDHEADFFESLVPDEIHCSHNTFRYDQNNQKFPLEHTTRFPIAADAIGSLPVPVNNYLHDGTHITIFFNSEDERDQCVSMLSHLNPTKLKSDRWAFVKSVKYNISSRIARGIQSPQYLETARDIWYDTTTHVSREARVEASYIPVDILIWFDAWRGTTTAVKFRLIDMTGEVFPQRVTSPFRLLEYQGKEDLFANIL
ncbi:hypothetical protein J8273_8991 [Carpediemonas membranifera]|uniref:Uncharacterized protein n=1 Tax=Carpediemonas membranifera TaxID=201153 RepID=A0A8J6AZG1_9EUKA|nr:hypothetical protein J8273_8991 [Carpediemonas membranifera]|eukprot:KAG9389687.1 hypothetical protein J8273_8991 [Carpediemonas membranifera]